jgi:cobalt-precorrin 5A hydrolase
MRVPTRMKLVAGLGFRAGCAVASLRSALQSALDAAATLHGQTIPLAHLSALATAADKAHHPALLQLAAELHLPIIPIALAPLAEQAAMPSAHVPARYGGHSVAEAAALAAAALTWGHAPVRAEPVEALRHAPGERSFTPTLLGHRRTSPDRMATAALASIENTSP